MTLHEAIVKLLKQAKLPMTTQQIADELNRKCWYQKKDRSKITAFQIHGRTRNYPNIFNREGSTVSLNGQKLTKPISLKTLKQKPEVKTTQVPGIDISLVEKMLINEKDFKSAGDVDHLVSHNPGVYCIRIVNVNKLPEPFNGLLSERKHNIIYIGIATESLKKRFFNQELRANGHGTFFRSIGAVLGHRPPKGSLLTKKNKRNYKFSTADEQKIIKWINENLLVSWVEYNGDFEVLETELIVKHRPLINLAKNPAALEILTKLRMECVRIANNE